MSDVHEGREWKFRRGATREAGPEGTDLQHLYDTCSYCGSLTVSDFLDALEIKGTKYSGSDWKYGFPHKFYVTIPCEVYVARTSSEYHSGEWVYVKYGERNTRSHKFYTLHLLEASEAELERWQGVAVSLLGIWFGWIDGEISWRACRGFQAWGVVGEADDV